MSNIIFPTLVLECPHCRGTVDLRLPVTNDRMAAEAVDDPVRWLLAPQIECGICHQISVLCRGPIAYSLEKP